MSVINDMLAQLDKRRAKPMTVGDSVVAAPAARASRGGRWTLLALVGVGAVAISATALGSWPDLTRGKAAHLPTPIAIGAPAVAASAAPEIAAAGSMPASARVAAAPASAPAVVVASQPSDLLPPLGLSLSKPPPTPAEPRPKPSAVEQTTESRIDKTMAAQTPAQRADQHYRLASELTASGHSTQAIEAALEALKADPNHTAARQLAAVLMVEKSRFDEAAALLRDGLARAPQQTQLAYLLARIKVETGDAAGALALLQGSDSLSSEGFALRAALLSQQGQYANALPSYEAALRRNPDVTTTWLGLAIALDAEGQTAPARQAFLRAKAVGAARGDLSGELQTYIEQKLAATR